MVPNFSDLPNYWDLNFISKNLQIFVSSTQRGVTFKNPMTYFIIRFAYQKTSKLPKVIIVYVVLPIREMLTAPIREYLSYIQKCESGLFRECLGLGQTSCNARLGYYTVRSLVVKLVI